MLLGAVGALHAADLAAEGLQGGLHAGVHRLDGGAVAVGHGLVLAELWRAGVVVVKAAEEVISGSSGGSWGSGESSGSRLSWRPLRINGEVLFTGLCVLR